MDTNKLIASLPARIDAIISRGAKAHPDHIALHEDARALTYAQLDDAIDALAARLGAAGVRAGDRVMLIGENSVVLVASLFAVSRLDAWVLIVNARLSAVELDVIRAHAKPRIALYTVDVSDDAAHHAQRDGASVESLDATPIGAFALSDIDAASEQEPHGLSSDRQCAALIYTTGTTGAPKGVMLSHRNLLFVAAVSSTLRRVGTSDRVYAVLPVSHVFGLASMCLGSLYAGATLRLAARFDPARAGRVLSDERMTIFQGVPAMHAKLIDHFTPRGGLNAPSLRFVYCGGSPLDMTLKAAAEAFYGVPLHNGYGMTESSPTVSNTLLDAPAPDSSVGPLIPGVEARIVPLAHQSDADDTGELWVRGPNVMLGYYRDAAQTAATVTEDGWLKTGDLARFERGNLYIVGRSKELIIRSGFNVYPAEVEQAFNSHPAVLHSAVIGRSVQGNEDVLAFVELRPGCTASESELAEWVGERLAPYKRPSSIRILDALPVSASGKVLKHRLGKLAN
ncbi:MULTISPECIES: class I adenylate-forming enzyme family protein [unclassified Caballeronia]|uniref:class I adenylate-forming enzyme family protein n=1 Tax=unclassified Caballeronia TaxID=2646786 RepID=UPI0020292382|nr:MULTISPECIES: class I adenylate-forming enzyme family protein [unclassified Caballeronia]MDR5768270.1 class I adenylate-forming enzyme family protein [Caballeronia sp. LZ028]